MCRTFDLAGNLASAIVTALLESQRQQCATVRLQLLVVRIELLEIMRIRAAALDQRVDHVRARF